MRRLVLAWVLGVAGLSALGAVRAGALPLAGMSAVGPTASDGERALAASAESPTLPSFILKSFPSAQDLAQEVGDRWVPSGRPGGEPLVTLERWPEASGVPSSVSLPGFGVSWLSGREGTALVVWGSTDGHHALVTLDFTPPDAEADPEDEASPLS